MLFVTREVFGSFKPMMLFVVCLGSFVLRGSLQPKI